MEINQEKGNYDDGAAGEEGQIAMEGGIAARKKSQTIAKRRTERREGAERVAMQIQKVQRPMRAARVKKLNEKEVIPMMMEIEETEEKKKWRKVMSEIHKEYANLLKIITDEVALKLLKNTKHEKVIKTRAKEGYHKYESIREALKDIITTYVEYLKLELQEKHQKKATKMEQEQQKKTQRAKYIEDAKMRKKLNAMDIDQQLDNIDLLIPSGNTPLQASNTMRHHTRNMVGLKRAKDADDLATVLDNWKI